MPFAYFYQYRVVIFDINTEFLRKPEHVQIIGSFCLFLSENYNRYTFSHETVF